MGFKPKAAGNRVQGLPRALIFGPQRAVFAGPGPGPDNFESLLPVVS